MGNLNVFNFLDVKNLLQLSFPNAAQVGLNSCVLFFQNGIKSEPSNESFWMIFPRRTIQSCSRVLRFWYIQSSAVISAAKDTILALPDCYCIKNQ